MSIRAASGPSPCFEHRHAARKKATLVFDVCDPRKILGVSQ